MFIETKPAKPNQAPEERHESRNIKYGLASDFSCLTGFVTDDAQENRI